MIVHETATDQMIVEFKSTFTHSRQSNKLVVVYIYQAKIIWPAGASLYLLSKDNQNQHVPFYIIWVKTIQSIATVLHFLSQLLQVYIFVIRRKIHQSLVQTKIKTQLQSRPSNHGIHHVKVQLEHKVIHMYAALKNKVHMYFQSKKTKNNHMLRASQA